MVEIGSCLFVLYKVVICLTFEHCYISQVSFLKDTISKVMSWEMVAVIEGGQGSVKPNVVL